MRFIVLAGIVALILPGCLDTPPQDEDDKTAPAIEEGPGISTWAVSNVTIINADGPPTYEPTLMIAPDGTFYAAGHLPYSQNDGAGSPLWWSSDGEDWQRLDKGPGGAVKFGLEGDFAADGNGNVYWLDVFAADATFSSWRSGAPPTWQATRPLVASTSADDRPHLSAHGDGIVYYVPASFSYDAPPDPFQPDQDGFDWFYRSEDGGLTWSPGQKIGSSFWFCDVAASQETTDLVAVACHERNVSQVDPASGPAEQTATLRISTDRGTTWTRHEFATFNDTSKPAVDLRLVRGRAVFAWHASNGTNADLGVAAFDGTPRSWSIPVGGRASIPAVAFDGETIAVFAYVQRDTWDLEAYIGNWDELIAGGDWTRVVVDVDVTPYTPGDYMMAQAHDGKFWVVYDVDDGTSPATEVDESGWIVLRSVAKAAQM